MIDLKKLKHIHFTGIKGVGMTSLALCAQDLGIKISGSDTSELFVTDEILAKRHIKWNVGFEEKFIQKPDLVITTGAHGGLNNSEVIYAQSKKIPVMTHAQALGKFSMGKDTIAVCGVGGKTTTSSMISVLLDSAKQHPSFAVGVGNIYPINVPGRYDKQGKNFICEADEFAVSVGINNKPRFSFLNPKVLVVTNIEHDHPDVYPTFADTQKVFLEFFDRIPKDGVLIAGIDNENVRSLIKQTAAKVLTYGFSDDADWWIDDVLIGAGRTSFTLNNKKNGQIKNITLHVPGLFNVQNAAAALVVGKFLSLKDTVLKTGIENYQGCRRRFEKMGEVNGATFYDDYAHHPEEIKATLKAAREWFPKRRIIAIFQPHTYSRTKALFEEFTKAFSDADMVGFMDIYASARETDNLGMSSELLAKETSKVRDNVLYLGVHKEAINWIKKNVKKGDIVLTIGAGDIFHLYTNLFK